MRVEVAQWVGRSRARGIVCDTVEEAIEFLVERKLELVEHGWREMPLDPIHDPD